MTQLLNTLGEVKPEDPEHPAKGGRLFYMNKVAVLAICDIAASASDDIEDGYLNEDFLAQVADALESQDCQAMAALKEHAVAATVAPSVVNGLEYLCRILRTVVREVEDEDLN